MTRDEVIELAKKLGYQQIKTSAGWIQLERWSPYGGETKARFHLDTKQEAIFDMAPADAEAVGVWRLRR